MDLEKLTGTFVVDETHFPVDLKPIVVFGISIHISSKNVLLKWKVQKDNKQIQLRKQWIKIKKRLSSWSGQLNFDFNIRKMVTEIIMKE